MKNLEPKRLSINELGAVKRKTVSVAQEELIKIEHMAPEKPLPLVVKPAVEGLDLVAWAMGNQGFIEAHLLKHGGILFRNFSVKSEANFEQFIKAVSGEMLEYRERSSPRKRVSGNIYTSTEYPADQSIFLHNENSYQSSWPLKIFFLCAIPAQQGGETPIADCRKVFEHLDAKTRDRFIRKKVMYVRNFGDGFGLPWQEVFQTTDKAVVEEYCDQADIQVEWKAGNQLRTRQVRRAVARHPRTGEIVWFNHAAFFHISTLEAAIREELLAAFSEEDLPNNTYYGDGSQIEPAVLDELREAYRQETVSFPWQAGDVLMLDNMLTAHSRAPFVGQRKVLVGMSQLFSGKDI